MDTLEVKQFKTFKLSETFSCLDLVDEIMGNQRPAVVSISWVNDISYFRFYNTDFAPMGTDVIVEDTECPDKLYLVLPNGSPKIINIKR